MANRLYPRETLPQPVGQQQDPFLLSWQLQPQCPLLPSTLTVPMWVLHEIDMPTPTFSTCICRLLQLPCLGHPTTVALNNLHTRDSDISIFGT